MVHDGNNFNSVVEFKTNVTQFNNKVPIRNGSQVNNHLIQTKHDISLLDKHLKGLNGEITLIKTKLNADGKKIRIIKIKRKKNKDNIS